MNNNAHKNIQKNYKRVGFHQKTCLQARFYGLSNYFVGTNNDKKDRQST